MSYWKENASHRKRKTAKEPVNSVTSPVSDPIEHDIPPDKFPLKDDDITKNMENYQPEEDGVPDDYESITSFQDENLPDPRKELAEAYKGDCKDKKKP